MKFLVVYNICEIKRTNADWYCNCIAKLIEQNYTDFDVVISGCKISEGTKNQLQTAFGKKIWYSFIDDIYTVNMTFNKTVMEVTQKKGKYGGYIYVDSGIHTGPNVNCLAEINTRAETGKFGMITIQVTEDHGVEVYGIPIPVRQTDYYIPIGASCNLHFQYFDNRLFEYYERILPDIFKAFCSESVFSYLNASLGLQWVIVKDIVVEHKHGADGASSGFSFYGLNDLPWNNLWTGKDINEILKHPKVHEVGFGYEECNKILMHNVGAFTQEGFSTNPELKEFIKEHLFLKQSELDYASIKCELIL